jgi:hypothetical protein
MLVDEVVFIFKNLDNIKELPFVIIPLSDSLFGIPANEITKSKIIQDLFLSRNKFKKQLAINLVIYAKL